MSLPIENRRARVRAPSAPRILAWLFLAAAGVVVVLFLLQAGAFNAMRPVRPQTAEATTAASASEHAATATVASPAKRADKVSVFRSQFAGFDNQKQPFSVKAERAVQDRSDANKVHLEHVSAELTRSSGQEIAISSLTALYDADRKAIDLSGEVRISAADQFVAEMARALVTIDDKKFFSEVPVTVTHPQGQIEANGMEITEDGRRILFFNRVKATFWGTANRDAKQQ